MNQTASRPPATTTATATVTESAVTPLPPPPRRPLLRAGDDDDSVPLRPSPSATAPPDLRRLFGLANEFKEGDAAIGVAAGTDAERTAARLQLSVLRLGDIHAQRFTPDAGDPVSQAIESGVDARVAARITAWTLDDLRVFLLEDSAARIREVMPGLRSEVIAGVVKLMSNEELVQVARKVHNPAGPGATLGAEGYFASRVQPNSATDDPEEVLMSILEGLSYGCGDAIFGINIVASDLENVAMLEATLLDVIETFGLHGATRHCVLAHIEEQMAVHADAHRAHMPEVSPASATPASATAAAVATSTPGRDLVRVAFQSIGGTTDVNRVFGVSVESLRAHARRIAVGPTTGLYYETGQGSAATNGAAAGIDMVTCEARAHGLARALARETGHWCIVNTVAGFIGPEVFKTPEQLLRACLEDLCMGKLHGMTFGLDVCSTHHMGATLDDMTRIQEHVLRGGPAFYMAVAGRNDPMLSYITTGFRDHPRLRERLGVRGTDEMRPFFVGELGVMRDDGSMTERAGDTAHVYLRYRRRKGDARGDEEITAEARAILAKLQARGMDLGYGHDGQFGAPPAVRARLQAIYDDAKRAVRTELDASRVLSQMEGAGEPVVLETAAADRDAYLGHPTRGEVLAPESLALLRAWGRSVPALLPETPPQDEAVIIIGDGLNADAVHAGAAELAAHLRAQCSRRGIRVHDPPLLVRNARVRVGYQIGHELFSPRTAAAGPAPRAATVFLIVGERPGNGNNTMSVYQVTAAPDRWAAGVDHCHARVVSGISATALSPEEAAGASLEFVDQAVAGMGGAVFVEKRRTGSVPSEQGPVKQQQQQLERRSGGVGM
ncbi:hypothetical protein H9P43_004243 [Blastocladiella emersonii ATCC 22665]|nr:hypothetical protein H9P43_004243 [Blastocladiella emersonii ATCC 22665]